MQNLGSVNCMGNFVSDFRGYLGPPYIVKVLQILVSYIIFGMFLLLFSFSQILHLNLNG